jgi:hypothetical protein
MINCDIPIKKGVPIEIAMSEVDDNLMDIREKIFNALKEKEISVVSIRTTFTMFENNG